MITGSTLPACSWVLALNCLQNSIMFTPLAPKAGPIGGEGLAAPPLICNFTIADNSFAIFVFVYTTKRSGLLLHSLFLFVCRAYGWLIIFWRCYCRGSLRRYFELEAAKRLLCPGYLPVNFFYSYELSV